MGGRIIVGSTALEHFGLSRRKVNDIGYWLSEGEASPEGTDSVYIPKDIINLVPVWKGHAVPDAIYTIKLSHLIYPIFFQKHKLDVLFLKAKGCKIVPELYEALKVYWKETHGNKSFLSLNKSKDRFFDDNVTYVYDHDYLHELVAYPNSPMYTRCLKDDHEVLIDKDKFFLMPFEDQVKMFREEIAVISMERWLINPYWKGKISWYKAHMLSLEKTVTTLTKGWASYFIVENIEHFVKPDYSYVKHLMEVLEL